MVERAVLPVFIGVIATAALTALAMSGYIATAVVLSLLVGVTLGIITHASVRPRGW